MIAEIYKKNMNYVITRAQCRLSGGATKVFRYDADNITEQNTCSDIEVFRANSKKTIETQMKITVLSIILTYKERGGRK